MAVENYTIEMVGTLRDVSTDSWNTLSGAESFYLSHEWLSVVEAEGTADVKYCLALRGNELVGALPLYLPQYEPVSAYKLDVVFDGSGSATDCLIAGTRRAYVNDVLLHPELDGGERAALLGELVTVAEGYARSLNVRGLAFLYLTTPAARLLHEVYPTMKPSLVSVEYAIRLHGSSFADYLSQLGSRRARGVRMDLVRYEAVGYDENIENLTDCWYEAGNLIANLQEKYGHDDGVDTIREWLRDQAGQFGSRARLFTLRIGGELLGCALFYVWRTTLYVRAAGLDYSKLADAGEYFALCFYLPIKYAFENGITCVHLGRSSALAKMRRGARPGALWAMATPGVVELDDWRERNSATLHRFTSEHPMTGIDIPEEWVAGTAGDGR